MKADGRLWLLLLVFAVSLVPLAAGASDEREGYLPVDANESLYQVVIGDGLNQGVRVTVDLESLARDPAGPRVVIPEADNTADCEVREVRLVGADHFYPGLIDPDSAWARLTYEIDIDTGVNGDTGGCLILIQSHEGHTLSIIHYSYVTDF